MVDGGYLYFTIVVAGRTNPQPGLTPEISPPWIVVVNVLTLQSKSHLAQGWLSPDPISVKSRDLYSDDGIPITTAGREIDAVLLLASLANSGL